MWLLLTVEILSMTNFDYAVKKTLAAEGVFSNHPADSGGATIYGISSKYYPEWFARVMKVWREQGEEAAIIEATTFYHEEFWMKLRLDRLTGRFVAYEIFDTAVNMGHMKAVEVAQDAVNCLRRGFKDVHLLLVDGKLGPQTRLAFNTLTKKYEFHLVMCMNIFQGVEYTRLINKDPDKYGVFLGWWKRVAPPVELLLDKNQRTRPGSTDYSGKKQEVE